MLSKEYAAADVDKLSDTEAVQWLRSYFRYCKDVRGLRLELELLEKLNLRAFLKKLAKEEGTAKQIIWSLYETGQFPAEIVPELQQKALENAQWKRSRNSGLKTLWRWIRGGTKTLATLAEFESAEAGSLNGSLLVVYGFWAVLDRVFADPDERQLLYFIALISTLQRLYRDPSSQKPLPDRQEVVGKIYGAENGVATAEAITELQQLVDALLDTGVPPHAIFTVLKRQLFHSPWHKTVSAAKQDVLDGIMTHLSALQQTSIETDDWSTPESFQARRDLRMRAVRAARPH